jgi:UDP-3-O-[3-hydroxymyristoyl] N-acetylglucosamine deacetylase/3-hydroxyacyl-[acyl-carrier-protein] dehydratase
VRLKVLPAEAGTGIRFRRVDLDGHPEIEASVSHVSETNRSTTLSKGNIKIHTVEHLLATLSGYGVDNAIVELDANEPPIGDGSSKHFCELVMQAGIQPQAEERDVLKVTTPIEVQSGDSVMSVFPHDRFKITCTSSDREGRFTQFYSIELSPESWERELSVARTFCFYEEIEHLIKNGLIRGGSLENAVVIRDDAVLTTEPLRYPEEFVRHKILDIVGDLSLVGRPIQGHVIAVKPSHTINCELAKRLAEGIKRTTAAKSSFAAPPAAAAKVKVGTEAPASGKAIYDIMRLLKVLPHRYPFMMVDRITHLEDNKVTGQKNVTINEPYFQGHFPGHPIMPGVLQLEAIAQVAGILMLNQPENAGKPAYFMSAENVKWRKPVRPGDVLMIEVELTRKRGRIGRAKGVCSVDGETVSEAEVTFMVVDE